MLGKDAFQEADIFGITIPVVKHNYLVKDTNALPRIAREAYHIATTGRPARCSSTSRRTFPKAPSPATWTRPFDLPGYHPEPPCVIDEAAAKQAADLIQGQAPGDPRRPGLHDLPRRQGADATGGNAQRPVTTTLLGKGVFPETHPLSLGMLGMHGTAYANKAMVECDLLINIGSRFDDRIIGQPPNSARTRPSSTSTSTPRRWAR
jgi:acetolactate synthase I/II/III large subunit